MKKTLLGAALALALVTSSCIGPDNARDNLHHWNRTLNESKWINELVFIGLSIIPVYAIFYLGDVLIFNSVEFWGGKNPIDRNPAIK